MSKFVGVFRELASFNELLHTQVELILVERLHRNWLKVGIYGRTPGMHSPADGMHVPANGMHALLLTLCQSGSLASLAARSCIQLQALLRLPLSRCCTHCHVN